MILGVVADDFTGATDVASMLVRAGMRTMQVIGVPDGPPPQADAIVVALKSRTVPAADAVRESLAALRWLRAAGARQCYFKYCSTFDSTPQGNIGPVAEALMDALGADFAIACPAFPENGRTVFRGHLFVGDVLLSDSGMRTHPLTPMTDANLVRVLQAQCRGSVGLLRHDVVAQGPEAVRAAFDALRSAGVRIAVADAVDNGDLRTLARACVDLPLVTAGSGVALGLPDAYAARGWLAPDAQAAVLPAVGGLAAVVSRSRPARRWRRRRCRGRASGCPTGRCWCMPRRCRTKWLRCSNAWAPRTRARSSSAAWRRWRKGWSRPACTASSSPAARPRAPWCRRWTCIGSSSARRSIRACRGRRPRADRCCWR